jgi:dipeptidyl aminopeptidase/acylaminoacyl peptidase
MKLKHFVIGMGILLAGCAAKQEAGTQIGQQELTPEEVAAGVLTPEVMYKMGRVGAFAVSGEQVAYTVSWYSVAENRSSTELHIGDVVIADARNPQFSADGQTIYFMRGGQLWSADANGAGEQQLSNIEDGIDGYNVAPTGDKLFYAQKVRTADRESKDVHPDMDKSKALIYDDLMARHWDYWDRGYYSHIFVAPLAGGKVGEGVDIMPGEQWDAPMAPYFDMAEIAWSNDGKLLAYTCKKLTGTEYAVSTDSDIYLYDTATGTTKNLTEGMPGYDKYPVFSPDNTMIAWRSMERPGNEADKDRLMVMNIDGSDKRYLTADFDYNAANVVWENNASLLFRAPMQATHQLCRVSLAGEVEVITGGDHDVNAFALSTDGVVAAVTTLSRATELFDISLADGTVTQFTDVNAHVYDNIKMGEVQKRWVTTSDGKQMLVWVVVPPDFDPAKTYPTLLYCEGGPQSVVSQGWSYRWNFQLMAAKGYVVVAPNRRGLPSFGQEWLDQISGDYSGQNIRDYLAAIDDVAREPWADETRLGCVGASYGGYSTYYLAGIHQKRFKAFIAHCGMFDFTSKFGSTEELFFPLNDLGGPYWDKNNATAQRSFANSPHNFVQNWDTPILIITGLNDFRIPYTQSLEAFTAARLQGIPARLVAFEDEAHQVFGAQNAIVWNREFFGWLDKYLK